MTAGNNGASTPEDDDPFGYLYEDGHAAGATPPSGRGRGYGYPGPAAPQPGVPRTSYNHVRAVGERQYGGQPQHAPQQQGYPQQGFPQQQGYPPQQNYQQQQQPYGQHPGGPGGQYAAPGAHPSGPVTQPVPPAGGGRGSGGRGPNTKGLLIGAIAVVVAVVVGITIALMDKDDEKDTQANGVQPEQTSSSAPAEPAEPSADPSEKEEDDEPAGLPKQDAVTLRLGGDAQAKTDIEGAQGTGGAFIGNFNNVGASVTWKAKVASAGDYRLYVRYAIPNKEANATLTVNGKANANPLGLKDFISSSDSEWEKNWQTTWAPVTLQDGENEIKISCEQDNKCDVVLDWLQVSDGAL
ncbi:hypothetical protein GCM10010387_44120 [Streptomyces inusitatus]|uniref:CBM6 domain-containing protein n=1 Tax=Streptomyces inusitatus TaxID=68221 RepID=A0A918QFU6_9ACTN|nr:CBM35 domain-containing protein [Streptomyces inusitatus]GGZ44904.1 hypothetical protein GCM10010387_44120 [Streptomyces inusitatus]